MRNSSSSMIKKRSATGRGGLSAVAALSMTAAVVTACATMTTLVADAYTFDPLNNSWRPSATTGNKRGTPQASAYYGYDQGGYYGGQSSNQGYGAPAPAP